MKVLVTGGAGFIGSHTVEAFLRLGHSVRVLDNFSSGTQSNLSESVELIVGDVTNNEDADLAVTDMDAVVHLAALVSVPLSLHKPVETFLTNTMGTVRLLEAASRHKVRRFVFASTCAVYGNTSGPVDETSSFEPLSPYAVSKLQAEYWVKMYARAYNMETVILRYFNVYGPRQRADSPYSGVIARWCESIRQGRACIVFGSGEQTRDFVFVGDVAEANVFATTSTNLCWGEAYNVSTGNPVSLLHILSLLSEISKRDVEREFFLPRQGDILHSSGDSSKLRRLGWEPKISLMEGLKECLFWNPLFHDC